ncbi:MAG: type 4a pilus biogenesis protein PilO [Phycisphaerae bacterium]|nr:type 4a pilus biogenesis protein PilO [Phycisphaerae bacterium]
MTKPERQQWIIIGLAGAIIAGFALLRFFPLIRQSVAMRQTRGDQEAAVAKARECAVQLPALRRQADRLRLQNAEYSRRIPEARQFAELWQQIADTMNRHNLTEQIVQPGKETIGRTVNSIPITIQCAGSLEQVFQFVESLRRFERTVRIDKCRLLNDSDFSGRLKLNAEATVFYQNTDAS